MKVRDLTVGELLKNKFNNGLEFDIVIRDQNGNIIPFNMEVVKHIDTKFILHCTNCYNCPVSDYCDHNKSNALIYDKLVETFDRLEKVMDVSLIKKQCILDLIKLERSVKVYAG